MQFFGCVCCMQHLASASSHHCIPTMAASAGFGALLGSEAVLRGGCLEEPVLVHDLHIHEGHPYITCNEKNWPLVKYLVPLRTTEPRAANRSVVRAVFAKLASLRDDRQREIAEELSEPPSVDEPSGEQSQAVDDLGLDDPDDEQAIIVHTPRRQVQRAMKRASLRLPAQVTVSLSASQLHPEGSTVASAVLMLSEPQVRGAQKPARIAFTLAGMQLLHALCREVRELIAAQAEPTLPLSCRGRRTADIQPSGDHESRVYFDGKRNRFVTVTKVEVDGGGAIQKKQSTKKRKTESLAAIQGPVDADLGLLGIDDLGIE